MFGKCTRCDLEDNLNHSSHGVLCDSCLVEIILRRKSKNNSIRNHRIKLFYKNPVCGICKEMITNFDESSIDHIYPRSKGGTNKKENLQLAHIDCNRKKADTIEDWLGDIDQDPYGYLFNLLILCILNVLLILGLIYCLGYL